MKQTAFVYMAILFGIYYENKQVKAIYSTEGDTKPIPISNNWTTTALLLNSTEILHLFSVSKNKVVAV